MNFKVTTYNHRGCHLGHSETRVYEYMTTLKSLI